MGYLRSLLFFMIGYLIGTFLVVSLAHCKDIKVMIIDSGVDGNTTELKKYFVGGSKEDWIDKHGHGTHIAGIIASSKCSKLQITSCKFFDVKFGDDSKIYDCLNKAEKDHFDIVNFSAGGPKFLEQESINMKKLSDAGVKIVAASGNDGKNLGSPCFGYFPACLRFDNIIVVGSLNIKGKRYQSSNYGIPDMSWELGDNIVSTLPGNKHGGMSGTSQAAAMYTKRLVQQMCH